MNNVALMGRLTRDPELRYLQTGGNTAVARFSLAVDKNLSKEKKQEMESKNQPTADFINIVAWGKLAENISKYTGKGLRVLITGRIQTSTYMKDDEKRYNTEVLVSNVEFVDWKNETNKNSNSSSNSDFNDDEFVYNEDFDVEDGRIPF